MRAKANSEPAARQPLRTFPFDAEAITACPPSFPVARTVLAGATQRASDGGPAAAGEHRPGWAQGTSQPELGAGAPTGSLGGLSAIVPQLAAVSLALQQTREQRDQAIRQLRACCVEHERRVAALREEVEAARRERDELACSLAQSQAACEQAEQIAEARRERSDALQSRIDALEQTLQQLGQDLAAQQRNNSKLEQHRAELRQQLGASQSALREAQSQRDDARRHAEAVCADWERKFARLQSEQDALLVARVASPVPSSPDAPAEHELTVNERHVAPCLPERLPVAPEACAALAQQLAELRRELAESVAAKDARISALLLEGQRCQTNERRLRSRYEALEREFESHRQASARALAERGRLLHERERALQEMQCSIADRRSASPVAARARGVQQPGASRPQRPASVASRAGADAASTAGARRCDSAQASTDAGWAGSFEPDGADWSQTPPPDNVVTERLRPAARLPRTGRPSRPVKR